MTELPDTTLELRIWIHNEGEAYFGLGNTVLLKYIDELGSLRKAAEALNMSYRRAWGKLKTAEKRIGTPLVEKIPGEGQRFHLTSVGREFVDQFLKLFMEVEEYAVKRASELLDSDIHRPHVRGRSTL